MIQKLLYWWTGRFPIDTIYLDGTPYMERYYIGKLFGWHFRLHRFLTADSDRHLHNHPWKKGFSLILTGGYLEEVCLDICPHANDAGCLTEFVRRRFFNVVNGNTFHRIHDALPGTWTLFATSPRVEVNGKGKGWGFLEQLNLFTDDGPQVCTVYTPYPPGRKGRWWETAPLARDYPGRVPL